MARCIGALVLAAAAASPAQAAGQPGEVQWWKGIAEVPGMPLDFVVVFRPEAELGSYRATIDIPIQGAKEGPLVDVVLTAEEIRFTIPPPANAVFVLKRSEDGRTGQGELRQMGMTFPVRMERITEQEAQSVGPPRPQTPRPPFPYSQREVGYENPVDQTQLAGTLTIPEGGGPHPAVILITGSGPQDRDETIVGHKPFAVIADHLTRRGIAVLRVDDRGVGGSSGRTAESTSKDFANDVIAGIKFLKKQPEIDPGRIGLLGHSEGGLIASMVAGRSKDVACIVLLAGTGVRGDKLMAMQLRAVLSAAGVPEEQIERESQAQRVLLERVTGEADEDSIRQALRDLIKIQLGRSGLSALPPEQVEALEKQQLQFMTSKWMRWFLKHDPRVNLEKVHCPVLVLIGSLDRQVPPQENLSAIEQALKAAGNSDVTLKELAGLNHLFQEAQTGSVEEYATIQQTIAPTALDELSGWLRRRLKLEP